MHPFAPDVAVLNNFSRFSFNAQYLMNPYKVPREAYITDGTFDPSQPHAVAIKLIISQFLSYVVTFPVLEEDDVVGHLVALPQRLYNETPGLIAAVGVPMKNNDMYNECYMSCTCDLLLVPHVEVLKELPWSVPCSWLVASPQHSIK